MRETVRREPERRGSLSGVLLAVVLAVVVGPGTGARATSTPGGTATVSAAAPALVERVRYEADRGSTRVIVHVSRPVPYEVRVLAGEAARGSERRLVLDFSNARLADGASRPIGVEDGLLKQIRTGQFTARTARVVLDLASVTGHSITVLDNPPRVVVDIAGRPVSENVATRRAPEEPSSGEPATTASAVPPAAAHGPGSTGAEATTEHATAAAPREERASEPAGSSAPDDRSVRDGAASADAGTRPAEEAARAGERSVPPAAEADTRATEQTARVDEAGAPPGAETGTRATEQAARAPAPGVQSQPEPGDGNRPPARTTPWVIVLDPGHGGTDPGTRGVDGVYEKNVTLAIAKRLKRRLEEGLRARVLLTRSGDKSRSLAERTAFANANSADLFVSIHANADAAGELHGIETYTLNNSNERATMRLAKMENGPGVRTGRGDLSYILSDMVQSGKEEESILLAHRLHQRLLQRLRSHYAGVRDLGVKKGPFYVLVGAYMPCVLVETSFLSHPIEGRRLISGAYQDQIAEGLYLGVVDFLGDARLAKTL